MIQKVKIDGQLKAVTPSRYGILRKWKLGETCPLLLLWREKPSLAPYPSAKLGDVVHLMMDRLPFGAGTDDVKRAWSEALAEIEGKLSEDWVTCGLLPLSQTVQGYTLKMNKAVLGATHLPPTTKPSGRGDGKSTGMREVDLQSRDGLLKGRADLIEQRDGNWILVDYKSGAIHEENEETGGSRIKDEYEVQLRLYCHLIREAKEIAVSKAFLRTLDGHEHEVKIDDGSICDAGNEARKLLDDFNKEVECQGSIFDMAKPLAQRWESGIFGCSGCLHRPRCPAYLTCVKSVRPDEKWPVDLLGEVISLDGSDDEYNLEFKDRVSEKVIKVTLSGRHPALAGTEKGDVIGIFNAVLPRGGYVDGPRTCVYQYVDSNPIEDWQIPLNILGGN